MDINQLININVKDISKDTIIFDERVRTYCCIPYQNHPLGCPNYNKNNCCPPNSPYMKESINNYSNFYLIYIIFNFEQYIFSMKEKHPLWTDIQLKNVLYWQSSIKKKLKEKINNYNYSLLLSCGSGFGNNIYSMESVGINVFKTLKLNDIFIETKPKKQVILTCLLCDNKKIDLLKKSSYKTIYDIINEQKQLKK